MIADHLPKDFVTLHTGRFFLRLPAVCLEQVSGAGSQKFSHDAVHNIELRKKNLKLKAIRSILTNLTLLFQNYANLAPQKGMFFASWINRQSWIPSSS